jgi:hypothetical protein
VDGKRPYRIDPAVARERAIKAGRARHTPSTYIRILTRAELTDDDRAALAALLAASLAGRPAGDGERAPA